MRWRRWGPGRGPQKLLKVFFFFDTKASQIFWKHLHAPRERREMVVSLTALWVHQVVSL